MTVIRQWNPATSQWEVVLVGRPGPQGDTGPQGPQGAGGAQGATGAQGVTGPIGPQGPTGAQGAIGPQGAQGAQGPQGATGTVASDGFRAAEYYAPWRLGTRNFTLVEDRTYFQLIYVQESMSVDRICIRTSGFSGSSDFRLGVYNNANGKPTTVLFDAGVVNATANNTTYEITISQTLAAGWYWAAVNCQTITSGSPQLRATAESYRAGLTRVGVDANWGNFDTYYEAGITGAFATAVTLVNADAIPVVFFRKA